MREGCSGDCCLLKKRCIYTNVVKGRWGIRKGFLGKRILEVLEAEDNLMRRDKKSRSGR